jgi:hypothetical protein
MSMMEPERGLKRTESARNFHRSPEMKLTRAKSDRKMSMMEPERGFKSTKGPERKLTRAKSDRKMSRLEPERGLTRTISERRTKRDNSRERLSDWLE